MRLIGMLGGMSPESTILMYRFMNEAVREFTGDPESSARVLLHAVDFAALARLQRAYNWDAAGKLLADAAQGLVAGGAELVFISANTMHITAPHVAAALPAHVPLLHIGDAIAAQAGAGAHVLLHGTKYTMELPFLREYVSAKGVPVQVPDEETQAWLQTVIYEELTRGIVREETRARYATLLEKAREEGLDAVVLGCTELGMLVEGSEAPIRLINTARAHAQAVVKLALADG
jgi:aspartate racemase